MSISVIDGLTARSASSAEENSRSTGKAARTSGGALASALKITPALIPNGLWQILRKSRSTGRLPWQSLRRVIGRRTVQSPCRKQVGRLVLNGIAAHAEDIAALGTVRQLRIWQWEPSDFYIIQINAIANLMPTRRSIPQNTNID